MDLADVLASQPRRQTMKKKTGLKVKSKVRSGGGFNPN
jgi:hypothetical protein